MKRRQTTCRLPLRWTFRETPTNGLLQPVTSQTDPLGILHQIIITLLYPLYHQITITQRCLLHRPHQFPLARLPKEVISQFKVTVLTGHKTQRLQIRGTTRTHGIITRTKTHGTTRRPRSHRLSQWTTNKTIGTTSRILVRRIRGPNLKTPDLKTHGLTPRQALRIGTIKIRTIGTTGTKPHLLRPRLRPLLQSLRTNNLQEKMAATNMSEFIYYYLPGNPC